MANAVPLDVPAETSSQPASPVPVALGVIPARIKTEGTREARAQTIDETYKEMERNADVELIDGPAERTGDPEAAEAQVAAEVTQPDAAPPADDGDPVDKFIKAQSRIFAEREKARNVLNEATQAHQQLQQMAQKLEVDRKEVDGAIAKLRSLSEMARTNPIKFAEMMKFDTKAMIEAYASGRHEELPKQDSYREMIREEMRALRQEQQQWRQEQQQMREQEMQSRQQAQIQAERQRVETDWIQTGADASKYPILARMTPAQRLKYGNEGADELRAAGVTNINLHTIAKHVESSLRRLLSGDDVAPARDQRERQAREKPTPSMSALTSRATAEPASSTSGIRTAAERRRDALAAFDSTGGIFSDD